MKMFVYKYPYLNHVLMVNRYLKIPFDTWEEFELCFLMNKRRFYLKDKLNKKWVLM